MDLNKIGVTPLPKSTNEGDIAFIVKKEQCLEMDCQIVKSKELKATVMRFDAHQENSNLVKLETLSEWSQENI